MHALTFIHIRPTSYLLPNKETWLIGVCVTRPVVCKPKVSMTLLCSTAAPDCRTCQSKGRYCVRARSIPVVAVWPTTYDLSHLIKFCSYTPEQSTMDLKIISNQTWTSKHFGNIKYYLILNSAKNQNPSSSAFLPDGFVLMILITDF